ncbi:hypothetical protein L873DRAFT_80107 [Choiromyces venosus 120613-1]|uniref:Mid2 domain-containing protein n=1 Tax=Choiromyces venosus 120613-1 TaxID=1336337 RepID=A0A3N4J4Q7_9PEZI|nr:hypothetical protein L873DRAFT_80107 [Choiromyces venosus 120613-1]
MMSIVLAAFLWGIALFGCLVSAKLDFIPQVLPAWCSVDGIERQCGDVAGIDGMCAFENDLALLWCCRPLDPHCKGKGQTCTGPQGDSKQTFCESSGTKWCCNKQYETCGAAANTCTSTFKNPLQAPAKASISLTTSDTTLSKNSASSPSTEKAISPPITNPPPTGTDMSPMAITGIAICAAVAVMAACGAIFLLSQRRVSAPIGKDVRSGGDDDGSSFDEGEACPSYEADLEKQLPVVSPPVEVHVRRA